MSELAFESRHGWRGVNITPWPLRVLPGLTKGSRCELDGEKPVGQPLVQRVLSELVIHDSLDSPPLLKMTNVPAHRILPGLRLHPHTTNVSLTPQVRQSRRSCRRADGHRLTRRSAGADPRRLRPPQGKASR